MYGVIYKNSNKVEFVFTWLTVTIFMFIIHQTWENTSSWPCHNTVTASVWNVQSLQVILTAEDHVFTATQENLRTGKMGDKI